MGRVKVKGLAAWGLALVLLWPGVLWSQGLGPVSRPTSSPRQADKPSLQNPKQKKHQVKEKRKRFQTMRKRRASGQGAAPRTKTTKPAPKKAPVSPSGK